PSSTLCVERSIQFIYTELSMVRQQLMFAGTFIAVALFGAPTGFGASLYTQTNLTSSVPGLAANTDPNLKNPWGMSFSSGSPFWFSTQLPNPSRVLLGYGSFFPIVETPPAGPTGQVANPTGDFGGQAFLFASLSGSVSGWNGAPSAIVDFAATDGAVYT